MKAETVYISEKAVLDLLASLNDVASNNSIGNGKEGMLILMGMAAGQIAAEIEVETGSGSRETVEALMHAIRAGIYKSRQSMGVDILVRRGEKIH